MLWLACDTSTASGSLALFDHSNLIAQECWSKEGSHSEAITTSFLQLLHKHSFKLQDLQFVATGVGPGSFTGIRVSVNFIRALAQALDKSVLTLNSLHLTAVQPGLKSAYRVRVLQYAFRNLYYTAEYEIFESVQEVESPTCQPADQILPLISEKTLVIGTGYERLRSEIEARSSVRLNFKQNIFDLPQARFFSTLVETDQYQSHLTDWIHTIPLYIRASEAEEKMKAGLLKPLA
jgi:tRNA threonylcarbamoyladenosine biosynthesis protein TsaB